MDVEDGLRLLDKKLDSVVKEALALDPPAPGDPELLVDCEIGIRDDTVAVVDELGIDNTDSIEVEDVVRRDEVWFLEAVVVALVVVLKTELP